jgi:hypothetical protein
LAYSHPATRPHAAYAFHGRHVVAVLSSCLTKRSRRRPRWPPCCC